MYNLFLLFVYFCVLICIRSLEFLDFGKRGTFVPNFFSYKILKKKDGRMF